MTEKLTYLECWINVAASLFSQALAGEPSLTDALPKPMAAGSFGFAATLEGEDEGRFSVLLDADLREAALLGEGVDQSAAWGELLKEVADAAVGDLLARTGRKCHVTSFTAIEGESKLSRAFQLQAGERSWRIQVHDGVRLARAKGKAAPNAAAPVPGQVQGQVQGQGQAQGQSQVRPEAGAPAASASRTVPLAQEALPGLSSQDLSSADLISPGFELLLDVELEASLRFGAREMPLGEILDLGPGDVVQLDRHIADPVDLIVGDKIVARGEVVLVNGNFGLRVTEVAEPQKRLESIRCLF